MAGEGGSSSTAATSVTMSRIEAVQTVMPAKSVTKEDSGWLVAGWIRESLGRALVEQPLLGGRLRRVGDSEGEFEIVSNDSGVRLMEARTSMALSEFLELKDWEAVEADQLVFWKDIDGQNPQFYPLFYVQVTNFERGGYSIGISCSLLLADPLGMASFLKRWASIHNTLVSENDKSKLPIFYLLSLRRLNDTPSIHMISSNTSRSRARAKIFNMAENMNSDEKICRTVASVCNEEAECHLGTKMASKYWLFLKKLSEDIKIEACSKEEIMPLSISGLSELRWDV
ncbi:hypothetical protein CK203_076838 [Vitis vinifera]|uniref:Uncharacterized protein n=1 Tax=Vitis vinifera TaxID=29760 RepID=A0A438ESM8_VITVI|nr:hypothetical protein CK203_076838 [Vitis vinifera]